MSMAATAADIASKTGPSRPRRFAAAPVQPVTWR